MKRLQVMIKDEAFARLTDAIEKCNEGFDDGSVKLPHVIEWMLLNAPINIQQIRLRCLMANKIKDGARLEFKTDVDELIKKLTALKPLLKDREEK